MIHFLRIFAIVFMLVGTLVQAQSPYKPFPKDTTVWWVEHKNTYKQGSGCTRQFTYLIGDTNILTKNYRKIYQSPTYYYNRAAIVAAKDYSFKGLLRNDSLNRKAYFVPKTLLGANFTTTSEVLLYDFNLSVGDTLVHSYIYRYRDTTVTYIPAQLTVSGIDSIKLKGIYHRKYYFSGLSTFTGYLIEGIGSSTGLLEPLENSEVRQPVPLQTKGYPLITKKINIGGLDSAKFEQINSCSFCPNYTPFPEDTAVWQFTRDLSYNCCGNGNSGTYQQFIVMYGDTTIGINRYKKIYRTNETWNTLSTTRPFMFVRNDSINKKVVKPEYTYKDGTNKYVDYLFLSFNYKIGDSFRDTGNGFGQSIACCDSLRKLSIVSVNGYLLKRMNSILEGVGIIESKPATESSIEEVVCFCKTDKSNKTITNSKFIYPKIDCLASLMSYKNKVRLSIYEPIEDEISIYPNPADNILYIQNKKSQVISYVEILNSLGSKELMVEHDFAMLNISSLSIGYKILLIYTKQGEVFKYPFIKE